LVLGSNVYAVRPSSFELRTTGTTGGTTERVQARPQQCRRQPWANRSRIDVTGATRR